MTNSTAPVATIRTPAELAELKELRAAAMQAMADHNHDMATNPTYAKVAKRRDGNKFSL